MENSPNQVERVNEEGRAKKEEAETEKNEEQMDKATGCETEEETTDEERNGQYCPGKEHTSRGHGEGSGH